MVELEKGEAYFLEGQKQQISFLLQILPTQKQKEIWLLDFESI